MTIGTTIDTTTIEASIAADATMMITMTADTMTVDTRTDDMTNRGGSQSTIAAVAG